MTEPNDESGGIYDSNNLDLIYDYTESTLKASNEEVNGINTKLGTVIAFNSVLIRTVMDLPDQLLVIEELPCYLCLIIKVIVFSLLISSIWVSISGLTTSPFFSVVRPGELLDNWYAEDRERCKIFIVKGLRQAVEGLDREKTEKSGKLNRSLLLLAVAVSLYALGALTPALISVL